MRQLAVMSKEVKKHRKKSFAGNRMLKPLVIAAALCCFVYIVVSQQFTINGYNKELEQCKKEIKRQESAISQLKEKVKQNSTEESRENRARDEGYVYDDETVFIVGN